MCSNAWREISPVPAVTEQRAGHGIPCLRGAIELARLPCVPAVPREWWATIRIGGRQPGAEPACPLLARLRPTTAQRYDVVDRSHEVGRQIDIHHLREIARANTRQPHRAFYIASPRSW